MFKTWQIFAFSLIPLVLVLVGAIAGSVHGSDSAKEVFPTVAPRTGSTAGSQGGGSSNPGELRVVAKNSVFESRTLTAPAESSVTVILDNQDVGVLHNVSFYQTRQATTSIHIGELEAGPTEIESKFTTPGAGSYFFRCDVHPDTMTGTFTVR